MERFVRANCSGLINSKIPGILPFGKIGMTFLFYIKKVFLSPAVVFVIARSVATWQSSTPVYGWCYDFIINTCFEVEDHHVGLKSSSWWRWCACFEVEDHHVGLKSSSWWQRIFYYNSLNMTGKKLSAWIKIMLDKFILMRYCCVIC